MKQILNSREMQEIDRHTIEDIGIPSMVLMERAALSVVEELEKTIKITDTILCVCGTGNNGGDGIAIARMLYQKGYQVTVCILGDKTKCSAETKQQYQIAKNIGVKFEDKKETKEYTIIVDAIFGIGLTRDIGGIYEEYVERINREKHFVCAVDIPSGICSNTGKIRHTAIKADITVTFGYWKLGLLLYPGAEYAGRVVVADIGFDGFAANTEFEKFLYEAEDITRLLPKRKTYSNKGTYGKVLIIAGSKNMSGACFLSAKAAYRSGAGLVRIVTPEENRIIMQTSLPEAVLDTYRLETFPEDCLRIKKYIEESDSIVIGPGMGKDSEAEQLLQMVIENSKVPTVVDADALHLLVKLGKIPPYQKEKPCKWNLPEYFILTPHRKELAMLLGNQTTVKEICDNLLTILRSCSNNPNITVLKDARTIVLKDKRCYINTSGNDGMATAGAGDVLTGIIAGLAGQGLSPYDAATLGVYLHGLAGDKVSISKGKYSLLAEDIVEGIIVVLSEISSQIPRSKLRGMT
ncbi:MAG: NAD(P)H-hydrate dehydratase [Clostridiales bacterium]|nr:NAD(P)H-hydrate dehydratase [Clostridiales bacterium]